MAYEKLYNEIYAVVVLKYFWKPYQEGFVKWESPDWVNPKMDLGIEVSQALLPADGQAESFLEAYLGKPEEEIPAAAREKYEGKLYFYNGRLWALLNEEPSAVSYQEKVRIRFGCKLQKLNSNYTHFRCNILYLYTHAEPKSLQEVATILQSLAALQQPELFRFQKVFLDCSSTVYVLDFVQQQIESIRIPEKARLFLEAEAEQMRHQRLWENGSVFA